MAYKGGLKKWFKEDWRDVKTGKACGRKSAKGKSKRPYPACRPKAAASKMTAAQKKKVASRKQSSKRVSWPVSPSGRRKKKAPRRKRGA
jgi:hypothetical protein